MLRSRIGAGTIAARTDVPEHEPEAHGCEEHEQREGDEINRPVAAHDREARQDKGEPADDDQLDVFRRETIELHTTYFLDG